MATYDRVTPANLTNFAPVINDPTGAEDANKVNLVDLQTRRFIYDFLASKFDSTASDVLKAAAVVDATLAGKVKGSTGNAGTQQALVQGTVSTPDLRDAAVTTGKIADSAISTAKVADGAITTVKHADSPNGISTAKINDSQITEGKLADDSVTAAKLKDSASTDSDRAVTTDHIRDLNVTTAKIANNAVTGAKLVAGTAGFILVANSSGVYTGVAMSGDATISNAGVVTVGALGFAKVIERAGNTVVGGANSAATWNVRGVTVAWVKEFETVTSLVTLGASGKISLAAGTYILEAFAPGYKTDEHICRISRYNSSDVLQESIYGTSELSTAADAVQTKSNVIAKMTFVSSDYFKVEHWTKTANGTDGLGHPSSSGGTYEIYTTIRIRKIA
jgi:hypothetical protein